MPDGPAVLSADDVEEVHTLAPSDVEEVSPKQYLPAVNKAIATVPKPPNVLDVAAAYPGTLPTNVPKNWTGKAIPQPKVGLPEVAGVATDLLAPGTIAPGRLDESPAQTVKTGVRGMETPGQRGTGALRTVAGVLDAAAPLAGPMAVENPLTFARAAGEGYVGGKAAKYGSKALGANPEQQDLAENIGQMTPILAHAALQPEAGVETTPEGTRVAGTVLGGKAGAGVAVTPEGVTVRGKVGPLEGSKTFARGPKAGPALEPPTIEGVIANAPRADIADYLQKAGGDPEKAKAMYVADQTAKQESTAPPTEAPKPAVAKKAPEPTQTILPPEKPAPAVKEPVVPPTLELKPSEVEVAEAKPAVQSVKPPAGNEVMAGSKEAVPQPKEVAQPGKEVLPEAQTSPEPASLAKGSPVTLPDGRSGTVKYVSPEDKSPVVTVTIDGKTERFVGQKEVSTLKLTPEFQAIVDKGKVEPRPGSIATDIGDWKAPPELGVSHAPDYGQKARVDVEKAMGGPLKREGGKNGGTETGEAAPAVPGESLSGADRKGQEVDKEGKEEVARNFTEEAKKDLTGFLRREPTDAEIQQRAKYLEGKANPKPIQWEEHEITPTRAGLVGKKIESAPTLTSHLQEKIANGEMPKDNPGLKKIVEAFDGKPAEPARMKQAQEALESGIVQHSRSIVKSGVDDRDTFSQLVKLYDSQPNLNVRTSTSIENQAYSTPAPLAFVAGKLAGIGKKTRTYEPTAGNGMLLIGAEPKNVIANELNPERAASLKEQGFMVTQGDALKADVPAKSQDAVVTNPPFGSVKDAQGNATKERVDGYKIGQIDHLIAAKALDAMKDNGKATLILGANKFTPGGQSTDDNIFLNWLYSHYNVVGHFEVEGKLYGRQGAAWPVRIIAIDGRHVSDAIAPKPESIERARTWDDVYKQASKIMAAGPAEPARERGADNSIQRQPANEPRSVRTEPRATPERTDQETSRPSTPSVNEQPRTPARPVSDRNAERTGGVAVSDPSVRPDADVARSDQLEKGHKPNERTPKLGADQRSSLAISPKSNDFQTPYTPASGKKDANVLIPVNMKSPLEQAMNALEDEVGDIDKFTAKELGYDSVSDLHDAFMGLQVDSVAAAIHEIQQGKAIVIADQTGIGKGRQAAGIIRWAAKQGHIPVFITKAPSLFTDMYGDLADIGTDDVKPFIMNSDEWITRPDGSRAFTNKPGHRKVLEQIRNTGELPDGRNAVFLTYSQVNVPNTQQQVLSSLARKAVFVLDESHNAGGDSNTGDFLRGLLADAKGVTYLSATYAKRPDNMPLYFKTDMGEAIGDSGTLVQAMKDGGLPLQTVVSNNLVKAGQMFRRERSYDGISMKTKVDTEHRAEHTKIADGATSALRAIVDADHAFHTTYVEEAQKQAAKENKANKIVGGGNEAGKSVNHTEFSSVVHNFVRQMLLGIKADTAAEDAVAAIRRGEKPVIAVDNTMGSFLSAYVGDNNLKDGDHLESFDYRTVLSRALDRTRYLQVTNAQGDKHKEYVPIEKLDPATASAYKEAQDTIDKLNINLPVSPIDWIRQRVEEAGYSVAEITGRNLSVDYSDPEKPKLSHVPTQEQHDKVETIRRFNDGRLDSLLLNVAGSTGISAHASEKFADQKPRHMIVAQPAQDINIFMQMLGRINRTGQTKLPSYTILNADLPAEKRPTALLSKKMKSLNANTSSNTESATSVKAADMLNKYGDQIVGAYLGDNPELAHMLHVEPLNEDGTATPDIARKATGRLAILPVKVQDAFYREVEQQYHDYIAYLDSTNQNELEPKTFDYDAKETRSDELVPATNPDSPFGEAAVYGEYSIKSQGKPLTSEEVMSTIKENLAGKTAEQQHEALLEKLESEFYLYKNSLDPESPTFSHADTVRQHGRSIIPQTGSTYRVEINGDVHSAAVVNVKSSHKGTGNPYALSKINITLATNGSLRTIAVPATQFERIIAAYLYDEPQNIYRGTKTETRETAKIITGNLLAAYGELTETRGTIINFTKADGTTEQGILLPKKFELKQNTRGDYRLRDAAHAAKFLRKSINPRIEDMGIASRDGNVRVVNDGGKMTIVTPKSKARGGKYFLDHSLTDLTGDFVSQQNTMRASIPKGKEAQVLEQLMKKATLYASPSMAEEAKTFAPKGDPTRKETPAKPESILTGESGSFSPSALNPVRIKESYQDAIKTFIDKKLKLGDKYWKLKDYDPQVADTLHLVDNAPRYFREKAKANLDKTLKGLSDDQVRLTHLMVDSDSRDDLATNHPQEFQSAIGDPKVVAAIQAFMPLQQELTADRQALGWPVRKSLSVENDPSSANPWVVKDRQGNPVADFKTATQAENFVEKNATVEPHLKRTYPEHSKSPLPADIGAGPFTGSFYADKGLRPPKMDKKSREMSAQYHYEHGRKDFSGYLDSYAQTKEAVLKQHLFDDFTNDATAWKAGTAQPPKIQYNGKEYVRPDIAMKAKKGGTTLEPYAVYDPSRGEKFLIKTPDYSTLSTGKPGIGPNDRYLAPEVVVDALENYDASRGGNGPSSLRRFFQEQIVGLFGPMVHVNNIIRHLGQATGTGAFDPRSWPSIARVIASPKLRERMLKGVDDATIDLLVQRGAFTDWSDIGNLNRYIGGNLNPLTWIRAVGKGVLFDPKFAGGWGGLDPKARVVIADYFKDHYPRMKDQEVADAVNDALGNYNRANWTERQKQLARFTLFPGWDTASAKWFLRHPFKVGIAGALVVLAINLALRQAGLNKDDDAYDFSYIHLGDRKYRSGLVSDSMGEHFTAPILSGAEAKLKGDDVVAGVTQGVMKGTSSLVGQFSGPTVEMVADQIYNRKYAGGASEIVNPQDRYTPGTWAPNRELEKRIAFAALKGLPAINRFLSPKGDLDAAQGLGSVVGVSNYKYGAEERLKSNAARSMTVSQTLSHLAETEPEAAAKFVEDPNKAVYLTFNGYFSQMEKDLKELDTEIERVRLSDLPSDQRRSTLESLKDSRVQLLNAADAVNDQLSQAKLQMKKAQ